MQVCIISSTSGRTIFEYAVPDSTHLYKIRNVTTNTNNSSVGVVAEQLVNSNFQTVKTVDEHGVSTEYTYDTNGSVTKVVTKAPTDTLLNVEESSVYHDNNLLKFSSHRRYLVDYTQSYVYGNDYELTQETQPNTQQINFAYSSNKLASISSALDSQTPHNNIAHCGDFVEAISDTRTAVDFDYDERHNISQAKIADAVVLSKVITYNNKLRHFLTKKLLTVLTRRRAKCIIILQTKLKLVVWPIEGGRHVLGKFIVAF